MRDLRLTLPAVRRTSLGPCPDSSDVVDLLHGWYPPATADSWDAVGLVAGDPGQDVRKVLFAVDPAPAVAQEAAEWGADLLVVHHPLFLKPVHGIARTTPKARTLGVLLDAGCALLTAHTNADQAVGGVSEALATTLGLTNLAPVVARDPFAHGQAHRLRARRRRREAPRGARRRGRRHDRRLRLRLVQHAGRGPVPADRRGEPGRRRGRAARGRRRGPGRGGARRARGVRPSSPPLLAAHPYEEPAYDVVELAPATPAGTGSGRIGDVEPTTLGDFARVVAERLPATAGGVRVGGDAGRPVRRVAVCGGAGDFMLDAVLATDADVYVTSDLRHHPASEFLEKGGPALVDVVALGGRVDLAAGGGGESAGGAGRYGGDPSEHRRHRPMARSLPLKADPAAQLALLDLQAIDARVDVLRHQRRTLPELAEIAALEESRAGFDAQRRDAQILVDDLTAEQSKVDADVEQVKTRRTRDRDRMDQGLISNPKDLARMQGELESLERRITTLEDEELEVMARLEDAQKDLDGFAAQVAAADERLAVLGAARDEKTSALDAELASLDAERRPAADGLPADLLALYDKLRESKGGVGAALLRARECSGCRLTLDAHEIAEIRAMPEDSVYRCEECQRILVRTAESGL